MAAPRHPKEAMRMAALKSYEILDTPPAAGFDRLTRLASALIGAPIATVTLIDAQRQWFKSKVGTKDSETPREHAFCAHAILGNDVMVVEDATKDARFADNPLVTGDPNIRFYAGAPLMSKDGLGLGTLCVIDAKPRTLAPEHRRILKDLAAMAADELELHKSLRQLHKRKLELDRANDGLRTANRKLESLATTDGLTGVANRRALDAAMARELRRAARRRASVSLLLIDADNFKAYNDRYGHQAGDTVLRAIGGVLRAVLHRPADLAARYGGEEFAILLPETDALGALQVAEIVREEIEALKIDHAGNPHGVVTVSIGVCAIVPEIGDDPAALAIPADRALYRAKEQGRNQVCAAEQTALTARAAALPAATRH